MKNKYAVEMESPIMVAVGFKNPSDALHFAAACGALAACDPTDEDIENVVRTLKGSSAEYGIFTNDPEVVRQIKAAK